MNTTIRLGISTCPNDTFAFDALLRGCIDTGDLKFEIELLDIQQLNDGLLANRFDVAKGSFHAAVLLSDRLSVLPSGSALGFGVGPLLLASEENSVPEQSKQITLCPGELTTATLLFRLFYPHTTRIEHVVFSDIMPQLTTNRADFGVCIHEGRFTWEQEGLHLVEDLGTRWERETKCPLPLGGIFAAKLLPHDTACKVQEIIRQSLQLAIDNPNDALPTMRKYAQEFSDEVLMQHVDLYVNEWTLDLGEMGEQSLASLSRLAASAGITPSGLAPLSVLR
ncbi:MAG: 1,4-dihydroxy-6-naphthoate synthase [Aureliella sp.]